MMKLGFSVLVLAAPIAIYWWIIRPRLQAKFSELYSHIDGFWARQWARIVAFKTYVIGMIGIYASELPAFFEQLQLVDLSSLPEAWQSTIRITTLVAVLLSRAYSTTPKDEPSQ